MDDVLLECSSLVLFHGVLSLVFSSLLLLYPLLLWGSLHGVLMILSSPYCSLSYWCTFWTLLPLSLLSYWSSRILWYDLLVFSSVVFDSYLVLKQDSLFRFSSSTGSIRYFLLLSVFFVLVTSEGVIHSWALPLSYSLGGLFYGQCSEICRAGHSFMSVVYEVVAPSFFKSWLSYFS